MANRVDTYLDTLARMEPELAAIDAAAGWASIAISLKRIADSLEKIAALAGNEIERAEAAAVEAADDEIPIQ